MREWTAEERQQQSELIRKWKPWKRSAGAKTAKGKARSSQNAFKHGARSKEQMEFRKQVNKLSKIKR